MARPLRLRKWRPTESRRGGKLPTKKPPSPGSPENGGNGFPKGQPPVTPPYFRVRRMVFLQVAVQVRLSRAR